MSKTLRKLNITPVLTNLLGEPIVMEDGRERTLKLTLLDYIGMAHRMKPKDHEVALLFSAGQKIGEAEKSVTLNQGEYDALKRIVDDGQFKTQTGPEYLFTIAVYQQTKDYFDNAEIVKKDSKKDSE